MKYREYIRTCEQRRRNSRKPSCPRSSFVLELMSDVTSNKATNCRTLVCQANICQDLPRHGGFTNRLSFTNRLDFKEASTAPPIPISHQFGFIRFSIFLGTRHLSTKGETPSHETAAVQRSIQLLKTLRKSGVECGGYHQELDQKVGSSWSFHSFSWVTGLN